MEYYGWNGHEPRKYYDQFLTIKMILLLCISQGNLADNSSGNGRDSTVADSWQIYFIF